MRRWKVGEIVRLASGGPEMTVYAVGVDDNSPHAVDCIWLQGGSADGRMGRA